MIDIVNGLRRIAEEGYRFAGDAADEIERLRASLEAAEKEGDTMRTKISDLTINAEYLGNLKKSYEELIGELQDDRDALRAEIAEMEQQEPVAWHTFDGEGGYDYRSYATKKDQMGSLISRLQRPGYDLQKEQAIQEAIVMLRQCNAQSKPDCGEAGHDEGRCGNRQCLPGAQTKGERNE